MKSSCSQQWNARILLQLGREHLRSKCQSVFQSVQSSGPPAARQPHARERRARVVRSRAFARRELLARPRALAQQRGQDLDCAATAVFPYRRQLRQSRRRYQRCRRRRLFAQAKCRGAESLPVLRKLSVTQAGLPHISSACLDWRLPSA